MTLNEMTEEEAKGKKFKIKKARRMERAINNAKICETEREEEL